MALAGIEISPRAMEYVKALRDTGLYGSSVEEVFEHLILRGIREAITMKLIPARKER